MVLLLVALILALLLILSLRGNEKPVSQSASEPKPEKPPASKIASPGFYPARYDIRATYLEDPFEITGRQKVRYVNAENEPLKKLYFNVPTNEGIFDKHDGGTSVSDVKVDGKKAHFSLDGTELKIKLPSKLHDGETANVSLNFETKIPKLAAPFGHSSGLSALGSWYPVLAVHDQNGWNHNPPTSFGESYFAEAADYKVALTLPKKLTPVATGVEKGHSESGGKKKVTYKADSVRDFAMAIGDNLSKKSRQVDGSEVNVYYTPASEFRAGKALDLASKSLKYFSDLYGPYPYHELDLVDAPLTSGEKYSTFAFVAMANSRNYLFQTVIPHEVAHQWWYAQVGNNQFEEPWLDETLATYSEWLFAGDAETRFPRTAQTSVPLGSSMDAFPNEVTYQRTTYLYGAQVMRELSDKIGKDTLKRGLREYLKRYRYQTATSEDLVKTLSKTAGKDLTPFFKAHGVTVENSDKQR